MKIQKKTLAIIIIGIVLLILCIFGGSLYVKYKKALRAAETEKLEGNMKMNEDILKQELFCGNVQIGRNIVTLPCEFQKLLDCEVSVKDDMATTEYLLEPGKTMDVTTSIAGMEFSVTLKNTADDTQRLKNCDVIAINDVTGEYIIFPGGICAGTSTFEDVVDRWGTSQKSGIDENTYRDDILVDSYYEVGIPRKDIYAYISGGTNTGDTASVIMQVGGSSYSVSYTRASGVVESISATFGEKYGPEEYESVCYHLTGIDATFEILKDTVIVDEKDDLFYCIETVDGVDYIIGIGIVDSAFNEEGNLLETEEKAASTNTPTQPSEMLPNKTVKEFLKYEDYDFSNNYTIIADTENKKIYSGEVVSESIFFSVSAYMEKKAACEMVFYMHPVNRNDIITESALQYMRNIITRTRNTLIFS